LFIAIKKIKNYYKNTKQKSIHFLQNGHFCWTKKMSKIKKPQNIFKQTLEIATTLWIIKYSNFLKARVERYRRKIV
jgi:hypothetical protein